MGIVAGQDTVDDKFGNFKGAGRRANVTRRENVFATNGDASAIGIFLVGLVFAHESGVRDFFAPARRDLTLVDDDESVGAIDAGMLTGVVLSLALAQAA